jgi:hypothetical protein
MAEEEKRVFIGNVNLKYLFCDPNLPPKDRVRSLKEELHSVLNEISGEQMSLSPMFVNLDKGFIIAEAKTHEAAQRIVNALNVHNPERKKHLEMLSNVFMSSGLFNLSRMSVQLKRPKRVHINRTTEIRPKHKPSEITETAENVQEEDTFDDHTVLKPVVICGPDNGLFASLNRKKKRRSVLPMSRMASSGQVDIMFSDGGSIKPRSRDSVFNPNSRSIQILTMEHEKNEKIYTLRVHVPFATRAIMSVVPVPVDDDEFVNHIQQIAL